MWRLAFTKPIAEKYLQPGADSLIARYAPTPPLFVESPPHELVHVEYHVLLGDSGAPMAFMQRSRTVGRMTLNSGKQVLIAATLWTMTNGIQRFIETAQSLGPGPAGTRGIAAGDGDGVPFFVDLGDGNASTRHQ